MKWYQHCCGGGLWAAEKPESLLCLELNSSYTTGLLSSAFSLCCGYLYRGAVQGTVGAIFVTDRFGLVPATRGYSLCSNVFNASHPKSLLSLMRRHSCFARIRALEQPPSFCMSWGLLSEVQKVQSYRLPGFFTENNGWFKKKPTLHQIRDIFTELQARVEVYKRHKNVTERIFFILGGGI